MVVNSSAGLAALTFDALSFPPIREIGVGEINPLILAMQRAVVLVR